ncbi:MAG: hypothetical protein FWB80_07505, partial [Defluviitaleaceae bacterium]|nr:hypothetical protein [Defluviitaleaceae bacterium]
MDVKSGHVIKFAVMSIIGIFLFMVLLPDGAGSANIPLGFAINWLGLTLNSVNVGGFGLVFLIAAVIITASLIMTLVAYVLKPAFIMDNAWMKSLFYSHPVYFVSKVIGVAIAWMVFFSVGPDWLIGWGGGRLMMDLIAGGSS